MPDVTIKTPILDKIKEVQPQARAIKDFLEWLDGTEFQIGQTYHYSKTVPCPNCGPNSGGLLPLNSCCLTCHDVGKIKRDEEYLSTATISKRALVYRYFDIDEMAEDRERVAILEEMRALNNA